MVPNVYLCIRKDHCHMIIVSSRKFRDSQNTYFEKAMTEEVILQTLHHGSFRLVPVREGDSVYGEIRKASEEKAAVLVSNFKGKRGRPRKQDVVVPSQGAQSVSQEQIEEMVRAAVRDALASIPKPPAVPVPEPAPIEEPRPEESAGDVAVSETESVSKVTSDNELLFSNLSEDATVGSIPMLLHEEPAPVAPAEEPAPALEDKPKPVARRIVIEDEDGHEPIPEPSDEVKRHMVPDKEASDHVRPDFVDPSLYDDDDESYIVGDDSERELAKQLEEYRRQQNKGFFKKLFRK